jgi:phosphoglycolate phosphatase-like HAD superfamily hydrolase
MFVVSGTPTVELGQIIERRTLSDYFVEFWGSPADKTANIAELLRKHGLLASRCVMIGDAIADYEGAVSNSVSFLGRVPESDENRFADGVITFGDFLDFPTSWI